ncbi:MAG: endolytic transglycosylase MltG [Candidatus Pacebacteria bacterium]|nr:endolytic transglycosylase MltG [Candidatus Paceibacterota bacterium]
MKVRLKTLLVALCSVFGAGVILFALLFYKNVFIEKAPSFENRKFTTILHTIEKGQNFVQVANDLKEKQLINSKFWLESYFLLSGRWMDIKAGIYDLPYGSTTAQIAGIISHGWVKKETITILPGWNLMDIAKYCEEKGFFTQEEFFETAGNPGKGVFPWWQGQSTTGTTSSSISSALGALAFQKIIKDFNFLSANSSATLDYNIDTNLPTFDLEGYLFPDTYEVEYPITPEKIIRMALMNFQKKVSIDLRGGNLKETMIMASILEKEVRSYKDKQIVAGILWKRLKEDWPLQVDSTINYAMGDSGAKLSLDDLQLESAYNTYRNKGLPPGPICNPGLESIKAAVYYQNSDYWYYLSAKNGQTIFSKTFSQHIAAKARYLR